MSPTDAIILGLVQGLTEFLPVSSSGHLTLFQRLLGWDPEASIAFDVALHLGTLLAVIIYYRSSLLSLFRDQRKAILPLFVATLPLSAALFASPIVETVKGSPAILGVCFLVTALVLLYADSPWLERWRPDPTLESIGEIPIRSAILIGLSQLIAVLPGVSRSGSTISAAMLRKVGPLPAAEFSFLLAIPAIAGACLVKGKELGQLASASPGPLAAGFVTSLLTGLFALALLKKLLEIRKFWIFAPYLLALGSWSIVSAMI